MIEYIKEILISYTQFLIKTGIAFVLDFVSGIIKAILNRAIQSEKLKKTIPKAIGYISNYVTIPKFLIKFLEEKKNLIDESEVKNDE